MKKSIFTSLSLAIAMFMLLTIFIISGNTSNDVRIITSSLWTLFLATITFLIYRTGKISKYRSIFFIIYAFSFILVFTSDLIETRGTLAVTEEVIANKDVPLCPVAIPTLILPALFKQALIFPTKMVGGKYGGFLPIFFMWLVSVITLGRGWCSWGCFYGGIDEGFSKILKKEKIPSKKMNPRWRYFPFALLIVIAIWALLAMEPVYCTWLCPLKLVTEYGEITDIVSYLQTIIFITLGMGLLIILPILMKKRVQCSLFCPLGALQSLVGKVNPYRVNIDKNKCNECGKCQKVCPTFSITQDGDKINHISITCVRCGQCMDEYPEGAINYSLLGVPFSTEDRYLSKRYNKENPSFLRKILIAPLKVVEEIFEARTLFVFGGILFGSILSGSFVTGALARVYHLFTTGSLLFL